MKTTLIYLATAALLSGCRGGGSSGSLKRDQQQYDVVQEGQATSSVTSTINAPGEAVPPPAPMTNTNADTTTNFTLPQVAGASGTAGQPGTLAGTLPVTAGGTGAFPGNPPQTGARSGVPRQHTTEPAPAVASAPPPRPTPTDTTSTSLDGPPPSTSTVAPNTDTAPPAPPSDDSSRSSDRKRDKAKDNPPPPSTDTQQPPATTTT
ncbi:MAG TPA: hypothetical protein VF980_20645 [Thermoanaerobaculia bacterium]